MTTSTLDNINDEAKSATGVETLDDIVVLASPNAGSTKVLYLLMPATVHLPTLQRWSREYGCNIVAVSGFDWENDMTPWSAPNISSTLPPFMGRAETFLKILTRNVIPAAEEALGLDCAVERTLGGISLSGLFALWAWMVDSHFSNIGSISGSFWYDGLVDWIDSHKSHKEGKAYFMLGDLEGGRNGNARFSNIQEETRHVVNSLEDAGIEAHLVTNHGSHFSPVDPRIESMLEMMYTKTA